MKQIEIERTGALAAELFATFVPLIELCKTPKTRRFPHLLPDGERAWSKIQAIAWYAARNARHPRTIWRWIAKLREKGEVPFERASRSDKGSSRVFVRSPEVAAYCAYLHIALAPPCAAIYKSILRNGEFLGVPPTKAISYETVRKWLRSNPRLTLVKLGLEGQRRYRELMFSEIERGLLPAAKDRSE